jgi:uroporphyrinogen decarboxylase
MDLRERYLRVLTFKPVDYVPNMEQGPTTPLLLEDWHEQGLPSGVGYKEFFGIVSGQSLTRLYEPIPGVPDQGVIRVEDDVEILRDCWGHVAARPRDDTMAEGAFHDLQGALADRQAWAAIRDHFQADEPLRYPSHWTDAHDPLYVAWPTRGPVPYQQHFPIPWEERVQAWHKRDYPLVVEGPSMLGKLRVVIGFERFCLTLYDDPGLIEAVIETRTRLAEALLPRLIDELEFDVLHFWEDIAYNGGPILDPDMFEALTVPRYTRLTDLFRARGGELVTLDCDGDHTRLIPGWLRGGVNSFWPMEYKAGMDVAALRAEYGHAFSMQGGIDKHALLKGRDAIDRELDRVAPVVQDGGYIPKLDHQIPRGIRFDDFCYYMERKKQMLGGPA